MNWSSVFVYYKPKLTPIALFILSNVFSSSICPIFSFNLLLSIVLICSVKTTESDFNPYVFESISICVGNLVLVVCEVIAAAITSQQFKTKLPTHISVDAAVCGLSKDSVVLLEQIRTIDKKRLKEKMGHLDDDVMNRVNDAITVSFGLGEGVGSFIG